MQKTTTPVPFLDTLTENKSQAMCADLKYELPSKQVIQTILSFSKALSVRRSSSSSEVKFYEFILN